MPTALAWGGRDASCALRRFAQLGAARGWPQWQVGGGARRRADTGSTLVGCRTRRTRTSRLCPCPARTPPPLYVLPCDDIGVQMPFGPAKLSEKAAECRALAAVAHAPEIREQLLEIADQFERLARHRAFVQMTAPPPEGSQ